MSLKRFRSWLPLPVRNYFKELIGLSEINRSVSALYHRVALLELRLKEHQPQHLRELSQVRWSKAEPTDDLTWGKRLSGDAFIAKAARYVGFSLEKTILEIGPGYGRLLRACLDAHVPFARYCAVELSPINCAYLAKKFDSPNVQIMHGDAEFVILDSKVDIVISSLTFKHLFPTFESALLNISRQANPGAVFVFDLKEGDQEYFEPDGVTFIRGYTKNEVLAILERVGLRLRSFDMVEHAKGLARLLVIATAP